MVLKVSVQSQLAAILHIFQIQTQLRCVTRQVKFVVHTLAGAAQFYVTFQVFNYIILIFRILYIINDML